MINTLVASVYLKAIVAIGILREREAGREKIFLNPAFIIYLPTHE